MKPQWTSSNHESDPKIMPVFIWHSTCRQAFVAALPECSASHPSCFISMERAWMCPRASVNTVVEERNRLLLLGIELDSFAIQLVGLSLYQLSYPGIFCSLRLSVIYKVQQFNSWNGCSVLLGCWVRQLMYPSTFGLVTACVYMSHRPNESFVPKQYMSVVYCWWKNEWQESGAAGKHQVLYQDW
jgi:hypothetical protein